jgi:hypothetical protein
MMLRVLKLAMPEPTLNVSDVISLSQLFFGAGLIVIQVPVIFFGSFTFAEVAMLI